MEPLPPRVRVSVLTFNVHGIPPERHTKLDRWLLDGPRDKLSNKAAPLMPVDVYVIGLQEVIPLKFLKLAQLVGSENEKMSAKWAAKLEKLLSKAGDFALYAREHMWGIHAFVFVNRQLANSPYITDMSRGHVATGIADMLGNKGAVGIRFKLCERSLCFVCCHLEAGEGSNQCKERNEDYGRIVDKLVFSQGGSVADHDLVFYFGDLNYRLTGPGDPETTKKILREQGYQALLGQDELLNRTCTELAFDGCEEMPVTFDPTYKWKHHTNKVDTSERLAWTDRVIWRVQDPASQPGALDPSPGQKVVPLVYGRAEVKTSDHRPVFAVFDVLGCVTSDIKTEMNPSRQIINDRPSIPVQTVHQNGESVPQITAGISKIDTGTLDEAGFTTTGPKMHLNRADPPVSQPQPVSMTYIPARPAQVVQPATQPMPSAYQPLPAPAPAVYVPYQQMVQPTPSLYPQLGGLMPSQQPVVMPNSQAMMMPSSQPMMMSNPQPMMMPSSQPMMMSSSQPMMMSTQQPGLIPTQQPAGVTQLNVVPMAQYGNGMAPAVAHGNGAFNVNQGVAAPHLNTNVVNQRPYSGMY